MILNKLRNKIWIEEILKNMINGFCISSIIFFSFVTIAHFFPIVYVLKKSVLMLLILMGLSVCVGFFRRPSIQKTAVIGDELGLKERLVTYLEYKNEDSAMIENFKEELSSTLGVFDLVKAYKIKLSIKRILINFVVCILAIGIYFIPSSSMNVATNQEMIHKELKEESKKIHELKEKIKNDLEDENLNMEQKEKIILTLEKTEEKLKSSFDYDEGAIDVMDAQKKIKEMNSENLGKELKSLVGAFDGIGQKESIKDAFASGDVEKINQQLKSKFFSKEEQKKIIENMNEIEKNLGNQEMKKELLNKMKTTIEEEPTGERLAKALEDMKETKKLKQLAKETESKLNSMKERLLAKGDEGFKGISGEEKASDFAKGQNEDTQNGEMTHQKGNEIAQGDRGNQHMENANGLGGSNGTNFENENATEKLGKVERQENATRLGKDKEDASFVKASWQKDGKFTDKESDQAMAQRGEHEALDVLHGKFQKQGMEYIKKQQIPLSRRELVLAYFNKLNGGAENGETNH